MVSVKKGWNVVVHPLLLIILLALLQLLIALLSTYLTFTHEEAMWEYIGRNWFRNGLVPYEGGVDNKSPLIYAIFGLSDKLFGINFWFPRLLGTFCQSAGLYFVFKIANHIAGRQAGIFAITLYGLSLLWKSTGGAYVSFTETYAVTFVIIAFYQCLVPTERKKIFLGGVLAGFGMAFRLSACFGIASIFILVVRKGTGFVVSFLTGVLLSVIAIATLLYLAGINPYDFIIYGFIDNFGSGSPTDYNIDWKIQRFIDSFFYSELILFYPLTIGYFIIKKKMDFLIVWLIFEFIGINLLGIYATNHFKNLLPALSLTGGICLAHLTSTYKVPVKPIIFIIWISFFPKTLQPLAGIKKLITPDHSIPIKYCQPLYQHTDEYSEKLLGLWMKSNTKQQEKLFIAGYGARVQVYSERQSPTIFFNVTQTKTAKERLYYDLTTNMPSVIAVPRFPEYRRYVSEDVCSFIDALVNENYFSDTCMYGYDIYRRKNK